MSGSLVIPPNVLKAFVANPAGLILIKDSGKADKSIE